MSQVAVANGKNSETPTSHPAQFDFDQVCRFLIKVGEVAHSCGTNSARLEHDHDHGRLVTIFGYSGVFFCTPSVISFSFQENELALQRTHISKSSYSIELNRLALIGDIVNEVVEKKIDLTEASTRVDALGQIPSPFSDLYVGICYPFVGAGLAILNQLSWWDTLFSALNRIVAWDTRAECSHGHFKSYLDSYPWLSDLYWRCGSCIQPRYLEIGQFFQWFSLSGLTVWWCVARSCICHTLCRSPIGSHRRARRFPLALVGYPYVDPGFSFRVPNPFTRFLLGGVYFGSSVRISSVRISKAGFLQYLLGGTLGNLFGTVVAVIIANIWARVTARPTSIMLLPSIVLLVSGSIGFRRLADLASGKDDLGGGEFLDMIVVALTIAAGLLIGNTIIRPF